jgi:hypothetical protein
MEKEIAIALDVNGNFFSFFFLLIFPLEMLFILGENDPTANDGNLETPSENLKNEFPSTIQ